jgi:hypothetical protein
MSGPPFERVSSELDFPAEEAEILRFWKERSIFEKTLSKPAPNGNFVFYEGPPTANGLPHNGHVLTRVIKDLFPRYKTMRGWSVPRKAGWDTHGLPVEVEVEKELRLHGKAAIEAYGVEPFIKKCIESVFRYTREWEALTDRVAFWADLDDAYVTYHRSYVESVWWALGELFEKGLLYQGHKVVWWWAQGGTALSAGEVGQGYKTVDDPSVYVAFPLVGGGVENLALLVWTTTPWTLPSNMYAAVNASLDYAIVKVPDGRRFVVAKGLLDGLAKKLGCALEVERETKGRDLVGLAYRPPFDLFAGDVGGFEDVVWHVVAADFVTLDAGTGVVHLALEVATAVPTGGACSPSTAETLHPATWARRSLECIPTNTPDQGSCSAGAFCLPAAPTSLSFCIGQAGVATQCPSGSGYMSGPFVEYADPLTLAEGRSCSNCGCDPPADAGCSQPTGLLESNCTIPNIPFLPSQCFAENGVKGITAASVTTSGKCTPTGGLAVGTVTPLSSTMSFCCAP